MQGSQWSKASGNIPCAMKKSHAYTRLICQGFFNALRPTTHKCSVDGGSRGNMGENAGSVTLGNMQRAVSSSRI